MCAAALNSLLVDRGLLGFWPPATEEEGNAASDDDRAEHPVACAEGASEKNDEKAESLSRLPIVKSSSWRRLQLRARRSDSILRAVAAR
jgi:hypothetical protein